MLPVLVYVRVCACVRSNVLFIYYEFGASTPSYTRTYRPSQALVEPVSELNIPSVLTSVSVNFSVPVRVLRRLFFFYFITAICSRIFGRIHTRGKFLWYARG